LGALVAICAIATTVSDWLNGESLNRPNPQTTRAGEWFSVQAAEPMKSANPMNRLSEEKSPYLLQHAHNPVDWYPWGEEAFAAAKEANKPVFLSVGYSTCHWCHVMNRESFSNPTIAAYMNEHFINIKLDREERPDVDRVYMAFVQATTGGGGWPMSVWLTPDLQPIVGGTYFPPEDAHGRPGFPTVLRRVSEAWRADEKKLREQAAQITGRLRDFADESTDSGTELSAAILAEGLRQMEARFDTREGGFGSAPKFPRPSELIFLFNEAHRIGLESREGKRAVEMAAFTLEKMARGGIHDHLGGGFHRYSVDGQWHVPHFEKMLYDQAQLVEAYLIAFQLTGRNEFADTARDILDYVLIDMTSPDGGFYSAEDADSHIRAGFKEKAEGAFYVWPGEEIDVALGAERAEEFRWVYGVEAGGNAPPGSDPHGEFTGKNILIQRHSIPEGAKKFGVSEQEINNRLASSRQSLFDIREKRPRPHRDDKIITAWNGLMISAFAMAHQVLGEEKYLTAANRAADFIHQNLYKQAEGTLVRTWRGEPSGIGGFAEDYACLIRGLIDLYGSDFDTKRLEWALALQEKQDELFWDEKHGGYFSSTGKDASVLVRMKDDYDGAEPSPNTLSALNLLRLSHLLGNSAHDQKARKTLRALAAQMRQSPLAVPMGLVALDTALSTPEQIVIVGRKKEPTAHEMIKLVWQSFLPGAVWTMLDNDTSRDFFASHAEFYANVEAIDGMPTAYVCKNFVCNLPTTDPARLKKQIKGQTPTTTDSQ
jgi:uncharacterized protein